jgi:hypothetical protein
MTVILVVVGTVRPHSVKVTALQMTYTAKQTTVETESVVGLAIRNTVALNLGMAVFGAVHRPSAKEDAPVVSMLLPLAIMGADYLVQVVKRNIVAHQGINP